VRVVEGHDLKAPPKGHGEWVDSLALSPDGTTLATGAWDGDVRTWDPAVGRTVTTPLAAPGLASRAPDRGVAR
jgi:WD40 repeat protein